MENQSTVNTKPWWKSKVILFNIVIAMGAAAEASLSIIQGYFDPRLYFGITVVIAGVNVVLRLVSSTGISK